jgi:hypothetical protein
MSDETEATPDHPLTAILRGLVGGLVGFGLAAALVVIGLATALVAWLPGLLFALVYLSWRPVGIALWPGACSTRAEGSSLWLVFAGDVLIVALAIIASWQFAVAALGA